MFKRDDSDFLLDIYNACRKIIKYTENIQFEEFEKLEEKQDAVIRNIEIIGEATKRLSKEFKDKHNNIDWQIIAKTRDKLIHFYFGVDYDIVWKIAKKYSGTDRAIIPSYQFSLEK